MVENILLIYLPLLILTIILIFYYRIYIKNKRTLINIVKAKNDIKFEDIVKETKTIVDEIFNIFITEDIMTIYLTTDNTLTTNDIIHASKKALKTFKEYVSINRYNIYNKLLNNKYDELVVKIIYQKIMDFELEVKTMRNKTIKKKSME